MISSLALIDLACTVCFARHSFDVWNGRTIDGCRGSRCAACLRRIAETLGAIGTGAVTGFALFDFAFAVIADGCFDVFGQGRRTVYRFFTVRHGRWGAGYLCICVTSNEVAVFVDRMCVAFAFRHDADAFVFFAHAILCRCAVFAVAAAFVIFDDAAIQAVGILGRALIRLACRRFAGAVFTIFPRRTCVAACTAMA